MKKIIMMAALAVMSLSAAAGDWYAGGSFGFWRDATDNKTNFNILPEIGYNINSKWSVGATFGYNHTYNDGYSTNLGVINPYARYTYFGNDNVNLFVDGGIDLGIGSTHVKKHTSDTAFTYGIGFRPGFSYNISSKFSLVAHVGYLGYKGGNDASGAHDQGGLGFDLKDISFGFYYNF